MLHHLKQDTPLNVGDPPLGVCQVAAVLDVAVRTCPIVGAVEALTSTVVVALLRAFVIPEVRPVAVPVRLVATPLNEVAVTAHLRVVDVTEALPITT